MIDYHVIMRSKFDLRSPDVHASSSFPWKIFHFFISSDTLTESLFAFVANVNLLLTLMNTC